jgi:ABC-type dipeptide/oligopeptide/nickel transport system permease subunit
MAEAEQPLALPVPRAPALRWRRPGLITITGFALLGSIVFAGVFAPLISPFDPAIPSGAPFERPSATHPLGTNDIGQDILSEMFWGARVSLTVGLLAAVVATTLGSAVGLIGGYFRGAVDAFLMRVVDVVLALPFLPLMILLAAFLGPSLVTIILVVGFVAWARPSRVIRSQVLSLAGREYVTAARGIGAGHTRIILRHLMPGAAALMVIEFVQAAAGAILVESSLSFLGLGDPIQKSWGSILYYAQARSAFLSGAWVWWVIPPGIAITMTVLGLALIAFSLEKIANPRLIRR